LLEVMERTKEWSVVVALVGGGQEIFIGEAGLEEWGRAVLGAREHWSIVASQEVISGGASVAGHRLFQTDVPSCIEVQYEERAYLKVSVRSHRAQHINQWVNSVLTLDASDAQINLPDYREFPLVMTRNLDVVRQWLRDRSGGDPDKRCGLVATSEDQRFRAHGLENSTGFRSGYSYEKWFLAPQNDIRSSSFLEVPASEFECQGLELDWVGVCWGGDLTLNKFSAGWDYRKFRGARWQVCRSESEQAYIRNRYRVLLTRARSGMVIWVPSGSVADSTRDPIRFERVYRYLTNAGVPDVADIRS